MIFVIIIIYHYDYDYLWFYYYDYDYDCLLQTFEQNMFAATLTLRRVWLQVAMKIKLMLLPQSTYCSYWVANFDPSWR